LTIAMSVTRTHTNFDLVRWIWEARNQIRRGFVFPSQREHNKQDGCWGRDISGRVYLQRWSEWDADLWTTDLDAGDVNMYDVCMYLCIYVCMYIYICLLSEPIWPLFTHIAAT
jgi:hypothetical protein